MTIRRAGGPADPADGFGSVTTPAYRCVWLTGGAPSWRLVTDSAGHDIPVLAVAC